MKVSDSVVQAAARAAQVGPAVSQIAGVLNERIQSGVLTDGEWEAFSIWMERHRDEAGVHDYELLGGATAQRWVDRQLEAHEPEPTPAEYEPTRTDLIEGGLAFLNEADHTAFKRVWTVLESNGRNALRRAVAKASSSVRNEGVLAKMASVGVEGGRVLDEIPEHIWESAQLDTSTDRIIESTVEDAVEEIEQVLIEEAKVLADLGTVVGFEVNEAKFADARREALELLRDELADEVRRWVRPRDGEPKQVIGPEILRRVMAVAGGADRSMPVDGGFPVRKGRQVGTGFGLLNGPLAFAALRSTPRAKVAAIVSDDDPLADVKYKWRHAHYRDPAHPFEPHRKLNGRTFLLRNWENLQSRQKSVTEWPHFDPDDGSELESYRVGDHVGCTCAVIPVSGDNPVLGPDWFRDRILRSDPTDAFSPLARVAAFNPNQPRCPIGTGRTAGRFSNDELANCLPMVTQLTDRALAGRVESLRDDLAQPNIGSRSEARLTNELELAQQEIQRRQEGTAEAGGDADEVAVQTEGDPDYSPVEADELAELANAAGGFTVRNDHDSPTTGYGVADPDFTLAISDWGELDDATQDAIIGKYLTEAEQMLIDDPDLYVGAWVDPDGVMFLDLTKVVLDRDEAVALGARRNEQAIFGFEDFEEINTGGTGNESNATTGQAFLSAPPRGVGGDDGEANSRLGLAVAALEDRRRVQEPLETVSPKSISVKKKDNPNQDAENAARSMDPTNVIDFNDPKTREKLTGFWDKYATQVPGLGGMSVDEGIEYFQNNFEQVFDRALTRYLPEGVAIENASPEQLSAAIDGVTADSKWYPAAHGFARELADRYGVEPEMAAMTVAVLSPTSEWDINLVNAERSLRALRDDYALSEADATLVNSELKGEYVTAGMRLSEIEDPAVAGRAMASMWRGEVKGHREDAVGSRYQDQDALVRTMVVNPDGSYDWEDRPKPTYAGSKSSTEYESVVMAYRADDDDLMEVISNRLGKGHKVRTFYRNIADPFTRTDTSATIDSHQFSAGLGWGLGSGTNVDPTAEKERDELIPYKKLGQSGTWVQGVQSSYGTVQHALIQATESVNERYGTDYRPSEMQSMTWVDHRLKWPANARSQTATFEMAEIMREWEESGRPEGSYAEVRDRIEAIRKREYQAMLDRGEEAQNDE